MMKSAIAEEGFYRAKGVFRRERINEVLQEAKNVFLIQFKKHEIELCDAQSEEAFAQATFKLFQVDEAAFINCGKACQHLTSLHLLGLADEIRTGLYNCGLQFPIICTRPTMYFNSKYLAKSDGYWKSPPHQDWRSMQGSLNSMVVWYKPMQDLITSSFPTSRDLQENFRK